MRHHVATIFSRLEREEQPSDHPKTLEIQESLDRFHGVMLLSSVLHQMRCHLEFRWPNQEFQIIRCEKDPQCAVQVYFIGDLEELPPQKTFKPTPWGKYPRYLHFPSE